MTRFKLLPLGLFAMTMLIVSCQPSDFSPEAATETTTVDLGEFYGHGRLQLSAAASDVLVEFWELRQPGLFAASVNSGAHAYRACGRGGCTAADAEQVVDNCNRSIVIARRTCALLVAGRQVVWRGQVIDPYRRQARLENHNRQMEQPLIVEFPDASEVVRTAIYIDRSHPIGLFTVEPAGFGGFCQGAYDFLSVSNRTWEIRCNDGLEASGFFDSEDLARGGGRRCDRQRGQGGNVEPVAKRFGTCRAAIEPGR